MANLWALAEVFSRRSSSPIDRALDDVCVIGVPHDIMGELVNACIGPVAHLVRFFDALPRPESGKMKRRELERLIALDHTAITGST
jgi:fatty-acyl-CoA synthase